MSFSKDSVTKSARGLLTVKGDALAAWMFAGVIAALLAGPMGGDGATLRPAMAAPKDPGPLALPPHDEQATPPLRDQALPSKPGSECHNSFDPECGPFRWTRDPGTNEALEVKVDVTSTRGSDGETVTVTVDAVDPDARIYDVVVEFDFPKIMYALMWRARFGPWDPPARERGEYSGTFSHTFSEPGTYTIDVYVRSGRWDFQVGHPYGGLEVRRKPFVVEPWPTPEEPRGEDDHAGPGVGLREMLCLSERDSCPVRSLLAQTGIEIRQG